MKNTICLFVLLVGSITLGSAQVKFGAKAGLNMSTFVVDDKKIDDTQLKAGIVVGLVANVQVLDWLSIQPEALFVSKGSRYSFDSIDVKGTLNYLEIPVAGVIQLFNLPVHLYAGPQVSFLLKGKYKYTSVIFDNEKVVDDSKNSFNEYDFGGFAGLNVQLERFFLDFRAVRGLIKVEKDRTVLDKFFEARDAQNLEFRLTGGFFF